MGEVEKEELEGKGGKTVTEWREGRKQESKEGRTKKMKERRPGRRRQRIWLLSQGLSFSSTSGTSDPASG